MTRGVKGTEIKAGMFRQTGFKSEIKIEKVTLGQLPQGARYADITTVLGETERCWEGFLYLIRD